MKRLVPLVLAASLASGFDSVNDRALEFRLPSIVKQQQTLAWEELNSELKQEVKSEVKHDLSQNIEQLCLEGEFLTSIIHEEYGCIIIIQNYDINKINNSVQYLVKGEMIRHLNIYDKLCLKERELNDHDKEFLLSFYQGSYVPEAKTFYFYLFDAPSR